MSVWDGPVIELGTPLQIPPPERIRFFKQLFSHCFFSQPVLVTCEFWPETSNLLFCVKTYTLRNPSNHCPIRRPNYIVSIKVFPFSSSSPKNLQKPSSISSLCRVANRMGVCFWVLLFGFVFGFGVHGLDRHPHTERISGQLLLFSFLPWCFNLPFCRFFGDFNLGWRFKLLWFVWFTNSYCFLRSGLDFFGTEWRWN